MSFFWPSSPGQTLLSSTLKISKFKKRIKRKRRNKSRLNSPVENKESHTEVVPQSVPPQVQDLPIDVHPAPEPDVLVSTGSACSCESSIFHLSVKEDLDVANCCYLERNNDAGVCVKYPDKTTSSWTPIKISRSRIRAANSDTSDEDVCIDEYVCLGYQLVDGIPGFDINTKGGDSFWAPIAHRTRTCARLNSTDT